MTEIDIPRHQLFTRRLVLRPSQAADADTAFTIQSDWEVAKMLRMATFPPDRTHLAAWFKNHEVEWYNGTAYRFAVDLSGRMIGLVDIDGIANGCGSLGYWLERASWGNGYAYEAAKAVLDFGVREVGLESFVSGHAADNPASGAVLRKLGFVPVGAKMGRSISRGTDILHEKYVLNIAELCRRGLDLATGLLVEERFGPEDGDYN